MERYRADQPFVWNFGADKTRETASFAAAIIKATVSRNQCAGDGFVSYQAVKRFFPVISLLGSRSTKGCSPWQRDKISPAVGKSWERHDFCLTRFF
jgi:hypothetical protein